MNFKKMISFGLVSALTHAIPALAKDDAPSSGVCEGAAVIAAQAYETEFGTPQDPRWVALRGAEMRANQIAAVFNEYYASFSSVDLQKWALGNEDFIYSSAADELVKKKFFAARKKHEWKGCKPGSVWVMFAHPENTQGSTVRCLKVGDEVSLITEQNTSDPKEDEIQRVKSDLIMLKGRVEGSDTLLYSRRKTTDFFYNSWLRGNFHETVVDESPASQPAGLPLTLEEYPDYGQIQDEQKLELSENAELLSLQVCLGKICYKAPAVPWAKMKKVVGLDVLHGAGFKSFAESYKPWAVYYAEKMKIISCPVVKTTKASTPESMARVEGYSGTASKHDEPAGRTPASEDPNAGSAIAPPGPPASAPPSDSGPTA